MTILGGSLFEQALPLLHGSDGIAPSPFTDFVAEQQTELLGSGKTHSRQNSLRPAHDRICDSLNRAGDRSDTEEVVSTCALAAFHRPLL
jgi:hypothetical protein